MMEFLAALRADTMRSAGLLTRLRVAPRWFEGFGGRYDRASRAFPIVGAGLGALVAIIALADLAIGLPASIAALLGVATGIAATGALHEDGLADTADGLGGRNRERRLAIMRDSAIGTYGVLALVIVLALKVAAIEALLARPLAAALALIAAHAASRAAMVWLWHATPPARTDGAAAASGQPRWRSVRTASVIAALVSLPATVALGPWATVLALASLVTIALGLRRYARRLGGHTGDLLGACVLLTEAAVLVSLCTGMPSVASPPDLPGELAVTLPSSDMVSR